MFRVTEGELLLLLPMVDPEGFTRPQPQAMSNPRVITLRVEYHIIIRWFSEPGVQGLVGTDMQGLLTHLNCERCLLALDAKTLARQSQPLRHFGSHRFISAAKVFMQPPEE